MRRRVRDYVAAALDRQLPDLERYIARHLDCPEPFRVVFAEPVVSIQEVSSITVAPLADADYPSIHITVTMRAAITARIRRREVDLGLTTVAVDVELIVRDTAQGTGYGLAPQSARLAAWWGDIGIARPTG